MSPEEVLVLISSGEGQSTEFKKSFAEQNAAIESLCAFSHSRGGVVLFGVKDTGDVVGVTIGQNTLEGFANEVRQNTSPPLAPELDVVLVDGKTIVIAEVGASPQSQLRYAFGRPFMRVGRSTHVMSPEEQRQRLSAAAMAPAPVLHVRLNSTSRQEDAFSPELSIEHVSGDLPGRHLLAGARTPVQRAVALRRRYRHIPDATRVRL